MPSDILALHQVANCQLVMAGGADAETLTHELVRKIEEPPLPKSVHTTSSGTSRRIHLVVSAKMTACKCAWSAATAPLSVVDAECS